jgi:hypothetical protein
MMNTNKLTVLAVFSAIVTIATPSAFAGVGQKHETSTKPEAKKEAAKPYPLETCIVSDDKLGEMGKPVVFIYKGQEIKLCCKDCRKDFDKDPAKYLKKLDKK